MDLEKQSCGSVWKAQTPFSKKLAKRLLRENIKKVVISALEESSNPFVFKENAVSTDFWFDLSLFYTDGFEPRVEEGIGYTVMLVLQASNWYFYSQYPALKTGFDLIKVSPGDVVVYNNHKWHGMFQKISKKNLSSKEQLFIAAMYDTDKKQAMSIAKELLS